MYRIMIARNGRYYGQRRTEWGNWTRCTDFYFSRDSCRRALRTLRACSCGVGCGCRPAGVVEYV